LTGDVFEAQPEKDESSDIMIAYDLECVNGHRFEGWFDNARGFEKQQKKGLVTCPSCGTNQVARLMSTFGIAKSRAGEDRSEVPEINPLEILSRYVEKNFENVGADFSKEALKMHYGVTEHRNIRGVSTSREEETLREEGVPFFKFPVPAPDPGPEDES